MASLDLTIDILIDGVIDVLLECPLGADTGPSGDAYLQEDGSAYFFLEDGESFLLLE